ncbi:MAG: 3-methylornithine--L-lysine ligase PylC [Desulfobacteraceae bacterium]|nr:MAG: 3-methylornithine--L-lysine ligase PylC [Desulfobacteraceae bacterium]
MLIAVVGGKLQGLEAVYLARKAGWETLLIDKNPNVPAARLCGHFIRFNFVWGKGRERFPLLEIPGHIPDIDMILPALEDRPTLEAIRAWARYLGIPLAFDLNAFTLSSSKLESDALFNKMDLPAPRYWPGCRFPIVVKPDQASGSKGVEVYETLDAFKKAYGDSSTTNRMVIQEYITGPSYSIEVIGSPGRYRALQVTGLGMDAVYDCNQVTAPIQLPDKLIKNFESMAVDIAQQINLCGVMDLEAVHHGDQLKLLEIDARLPSQTPMAVYWSTGINMVEALGDLFCQGTLRHIDRIEQQNPRHVILEHIRVSAETVPPESGSRNRLEILGERIMAEDGPLSVVPGFFGADEAITSFSPGKPDWVATMIFTSDRFEDTMAKRNLAYDQIRNASPEVFERTEPLDPPENR